MLNKARTKKILLATGAIAAVSAPLAAAAGDGGPLKGGARNPGANQSQSYTHETEIIANNSTYGTRQSNKSDNGGGAIYGCRSKAGGTAAGNKPCLRATNLNAGLAFEYGSRGVLGGTIMVGNGGDNTKPFTTNATGVATGLNADRVDGKNADDFIPKTDEAKFAQAGDLLFAAVDATGKVTASRGGTATAAYDATGNTFTVTLGKDVSACSFTATENSATASGTTLAAASAGGQKVTVDESGTTPVPFHLQVIC